MLLVMIFASFLLNYQLKTQLKHKEDKLEDRLESLDSLHNQLRVLDSAYHHTFENLPIGPPLDTIAIQDDFGVRKHPIFGKYQMHSGVDMIDTWHDTVYATGRGIVQYSGWNYGYGRCIEIEHMFGFTSKYAHLHKIFVKKGSEVMDGQPIGCMGNTGDVTGQHLHYEISHEGKVIDPMPYIDCTPINVRATMYHPLESQCDASPLVTADGSVIDPYNVSDWNWIAISQDMLLKNGGIFNYGDQVYISGTHKDGIYTIHDCMNRRKTLQIDFLENVGTKQYRYNEIDLYVLM